jgi:hypothetical protein
MVQLYLSLLSSTDSIMTTSIKPADSTGMKGKDRMSYKNHEWVHSLSWEQLLVSMVLLFSPDTML